MSIGLRFFYRFSLAAGILVGIGCSNPAAPTDSVSGTWLGEYRRIQCSFDDGTPCPAPLGGGEERGSVQLTLTTSGSGSPAVTGTMDLGSAVHMTVGFVQVSGSTDGNDVTLTGTLSTMRGVSREERTFVWQLHRSGPGEMSGHWVETGVSFQADTRLYTSNSRYDVVRLRRQGGRRNPSRS